jgi:hypothetical protein
MIFAHTCPTCGHTWTPGAIQVAQVINVVCLECQAHIRYCTPGELPDLEVIKQAVFEVALGDIALIEIAKKSILWAPGSHNDFVQVKYVRLFHAVLFCRNTKMLLERITPRITFV